MKQFFAKACFAGIALLSLPPQSAAAPLRLDDVFRTVSIDLVNPSPDGRELAVVMQRPVGPDEVFGRTYYEIDPSRNDVWLIARDGHTRRNLTNGQSLAAGSWCAQWSPDGRKLAFLSTRPEGDEPRGGNAVRLYVWDRATNVQRRVSQGAMLTQTRGGSPLNALDLRVDGASREGPAVCRRSEENAPFVWLDAEHLLIVQMPEGQYSALFTQFGTSSRYASAADAAIHGGTEPTVDVSDTDPGTHARQSAAWMADVAIIDAASGNRRLLARVPAFPFAGSLSLVVSPDHQRIAVLTPAEALTLHQRGAQVLNREETSVRKRFGMIALDAATPIQWIDLPASARLPLDIQQWSADGSRLAFRAHAAGNTRSAPIFMFSPATIGVSAVDAGLDTDANDSGLYPSRLTAVWADDGALLLNGRLIGHNDAALHWWLVKPGQAPVLAASPPAALNAAPFGMPGTGEVLARDSHGVIWHDQTPHGEFLRETISGVAAPTTIMTLNEHLAKVDWGKIETIDYRTTMGVSIKGLVILPPGYVAGHRYPLLVWQYPGGTVAGVDDYWGDPYMPGMYNLQLYAARGYIVLVPSMPMPRGPGPNGPYRHLSEGVLPAIDKLVALGMADPARVGLFGQSNGGYGVYGLVTQTDRFAAAVAIAGATDLTSHYGVFERNGEGWAGIAADKSANPQIDESGLAYHANPIDDPAFYRENSPITYVSRVHTPLLMAHGSYDERADIGEAQAFYTALAHQGQPARLLSYAGENHAIALSPANVRNLVSEIDAWFDKWLRAPEPGKR